MVRVRHAAVAFLLPLPRTPAARRRRHWFARATGRGQQAAVRRHRRFRRPPARRRPRPGARRHRRRVRVPRNRPIARGGPGPDAVDAGHAARPRRLRRLRPPAECRRRRRLPATSHRRVRDRTRTGRLQRRSRRCAALQRHPAIQGDARLRAGRSRPRPFSCRCTGTRGTGPLQRPSARRGRDGRC